MIVNTYFLSSWQKYVLWGDTGNCSNKDVSSLCLYDFSTNLPTWSYKCWHLLQVFDIHREHSSVTLSKWGQSFLRFERCFFAFWRLPTPTRHPMCSYVCFTILIQRCFLLSLEKNVFNKSSKWGQSFRRLKRSFRRFDDCIHQNDIPCLTKCALKYSFRGVFFSHLKKRCLFSVVYATLCHLIKACLN